MAPRALNEDLAGHIIELLEKSMGRLHQDITLLRNDFVTHKIDIEGIRHSVANLHLHKENNSKLFRAVIVAIITAFTSLGVALLKISH